MTLSAQQSVAEALLKVAAEIRRNALGMESEIRGQDGMGKIVLAAEMGAIIRVMRCIEKAASAMSAGTAETEGLRATPASAIGNAETPNE